MLLHTITGIYQSLQKGYDIASEDIEFAIEICMEAGIFEVEITEVLTHVCSHMNPAAPLEVDQVFTEAVPTTPKSVTFEIEGLSEKASPSTDGEEPHKTQKRSR